MPDTILKLLLLRGINLGMKILIVTALFPPDIAPPAPYAKELAKRLLEKHEVTLLTYARLPEEVPGVRIIAVNKRLPLPTRLALFTVKFFLAARKADVIYIENGASVELSAGIVSMLTRKPVLIHMGDIAADTRAAKKPFLARIQKFVKSRARDVVTDVPLERPEILPFSPPPMQAQEAYRASWDTHIKKLLEIFDHARK